MSHPDEDGSGEHARLAGLHALQVLDTPPEPAFDALTRLAARICATPIALISLVDESRQWFMAKASLPGFEATAREVAFCAEAIQERALMEVADASSDPRFAGNPLVVGAPGIRFYAGAPLELRTGERVGTVCVIDREPRRLSDEQREALTDLARVAVLALEGRRALAAAHETERLLADERRRLGYIVDGTQAGTWEWNVQTGECRYNGKQWARIIGRSLEELQPVSIDTWMAHAHPDDVAQSSARLQAHWNGETPGYECEARMRHRDGHWVWVMDREKVFTRTADGEPEWMFGTHIDITERKRQEEALRESRSFLDRIGRVAGVGGWEVDLLCGEVHWSDETCRIHGVAPGYRPSLDEAIGHYAPEGRPQIRAAVEHAMQTGTPWDLELPLITARGQPIWVRAAGSAELDNGVPVRLTGALQDISARKQMERKLAEESHELTRVTLQSIGDAVISTDGQGHVTWLNPAAGQLTGWSLDAARGHPVTQVFHVLAEDSREPTIDPVAECLAREETVALASGSILIGRDGSEYGIEDSAAPIRGEDGELMGVVLVFRDVTEQRRLSREMRHRATHDGLTGLLNRGEFEHRLRRALDGAHEHGAVHALLYIDLDRFKLVNDACGHAIGDRLLKQVAQQLLDCVRSRDTVARLGGDEFAVVLEHCSTDQALRVAEQICERMQDLRFTHGARVFRIGASIGLVPVDQRWTDAAALTQAADHACYAAKEGGRSRVHRWLDADRALQERQGQTHWASRIELALEEQRFVLYAQRIAPLSGNGARLHCEVLLRMRGDDGKMIAPGAFLPAAERFYMASRIDRWVLDAVLQRLSRLPTLEAVASVAVNLSGQSLGDRAFHAFAAERIAAAGIDGLKLCLEVTETAAITSLADATVFVERMRALGVRIALDDFGAGASSFGYLSALPVDRLKIDGQFVRNMTDEPLSAAAVRCFHEVAGVVGVESVAEFVERADVLDALRAIGVHYAQGYLIHRPEPFDTLLAGPR